MVPHLNKIDYKKESSIHIHQVFEGVEIDSSKKKKIAHKYKKENIESTRYDLLHEENLNSIVEAS